jgi:hypothetical protein
MPAIASVDSVRSAHEPAATVPETSNSAHPAACSITPIWARRAGASTSPITAGNATAIVSIAMVMARRREAMSMGMEGGERRQIFAPETDVRFCGVRTLPLVRNRRRRSTLVDEPRTPAATPAST